MRMYFNEEQMEALNANPNVKKVTTKALSYSDDFKKVAYRKAKRGVKTSVIFSDAGFDVKALGIKRMHNFISRLKLKKRNKFVDKRGCTKKSKKGK